jgi:hypothetical protein
MGTFYARLGKFVVIWYFIPVLVSLPSKIWQPCFNGDAGFENVISERILLLKKN